MFIFTTSLLQGWIINTLNPGHNQSSISHLQCCYSLYKLRLPWRTTHLHPLLSPLASSLFQNRFYNLNVCFSRPSVAWHRLFWLRLQPCRSTAGLWGHPISFFRNPKVKVQIMGWWHFCGCCHEASEEVFALSDVDVFKSNLLTDLF